MNYSKQEKCGKYQILCLYSKGENAPTCLGLEGECNNHLILYTKMSLNKRKKGEAVNSGNEKLSEKISRLKKAIT